MEYNSYKFILSIIFYIKIRLLKNLLYIFSPYNSFFKSLASLLFIRLLTREIFSRLLISIFLSYSPLNMFYFNTIKFLFQDFYVFYIKIFTSLYFLIMNILVSLKAVFSDFPKYINRFYFYILVYY